MEIQESRKTSALKTALLICGQSLSEAVVNGPRLLRIWNLFHLTGKINFRELELTIEEQNPIQIVIELQELDPQLWRFLKNTENNLINIRPELAEDIAKLVADKVNLTRQPDRYTTC